MAELPLVSLDDEEEDDLPLVDLPLVDLGETSRYLYNEDGTVKGINPDAAPSKREARDYVRGALSSVQQGQLLGFEDEIVGLGRAVVDQMAEGGDQSFGDRYRMYRDDQRKMRKDFAKENPLTAGALEVAGAFTTPGLAVTGSGATRLSRAANALEKGTQGSGRLAQSITRGGIEGGIAGLGASEGGSDDHGVAMMQGAALGSGLTGIMGLGAKGVRALNSRRVAEDLVDPVTGVRKPLHLTEGGLGDVYRVIGRAPGAKGRLRDLEEPFVMEAAENMARADAKAVGLKRAAKSIRDDLPLAKDRVKEEAASIVESAKEAGESLAVSRNQRFSRRAAKEGLPPGVGDEILTGRSITDDAERQAQWWRDEGFREVKDEYFDWNKDFAETDLARSITERIKNDADLRLELEKVLPDIQSMQNKLFDPATDLAVKGSPDLGPVLGAINRQKRLPGTVDDLVESIAEDSFISGEALMSIRNVFATGANGSSKNRYALRSIANEFDDFIRDQLKKKGRDDLVDRFNSQLDRYTTGLAFQDIARTKNAIKRGYATADEWLVAAKKYGGKGMSEKKAPLRNAAKATARGADKARADAKQLVSDTKKAAKKQDLTMTRHSQRKARELDRAVEDMVKTGEVAQTRAAAQRLSDMQLPKTSTILSEMLSAEFLGGTMPAPKALNQNRTLKAARGVGVGRAIASDFVQDAVAGQAPWQNRLRAAILRGDQEAVTRIMSREAAREMEEE